MTVALNKFNMLWCIVLVGRDMTDYPGVSSEIQGLETWEIDQNQVEMWGSENQKGRQKRLVHELCVRQKVGDRERQAR